MALQPFVRSPAPAYGDRDLWCSAYDSCLDHAAEAGWDTFSCEACPSKGRQRLAPVVVASDSERLVALSRADAIALQSEDEARERAARAERKARRREEQLERARLARLRSVEAGAIATRLRHAARDAERAVVEGEQVSIDALRIVVAGAVEPGAWRLVELGLCQAALDGLRCVVIDGTLVRHFNAAAISLSRACSYAGLFERRGGGVLLDSWPPMLIWALQACHGGPDFVESCRRAGERFGAPRIRSSPVPVVDAPQGTQLEIPVGG